MKKIKKSLNKKLFSKIHPNQMKEVKGGSSENPPKSTGISSIPIVGGAIAG